MRAFRAVAVTAVTAAVLGTVLSGCGPSGSGGDDGRPPATGTRTPAATPATTAPAATAAPAPTTAAPAPAESPAATETLVQVSRSGGYAGQVHTLIVKGDGSWTRLGRKAEPEGTGKLSQAALAALRSALREADFARLPRIATGDTTVYDGFTYAFVHGGFEVAAEQEALIPALRKVLDALPPFTAG
ncbi:hypothetical protein [Streptomyces sp. NPDC048349]|uniref:hypothetical protein n=1 Tax=Streptomyces sp. NPDC048349 TaxID=3155486 RepID=UPI00341EA1EA